MSQMPEKAAALVSKMLQLNLYVVFWHGKDQDLMPLLADHLEYLVELEKQGKVFASGPMGAPEKRNGMTILRAADEAEARRLAENDPFAKNGIRDFTIEPWTVMEGTFTVEMHFSDGTAKFS
ncbi:YciI family protein [Hoeflea sp. WL0058]|uniref:YciI family protein n=1 Tax=Flavimaribacter sediminis TaxID=2865987 RepID=A0AAE2ZPG7_9HYPH|nr:YciI family protein [Flavimaribacter sediminis]MBW8638455.1 YciI family protein [Flavimaribacter sediminis]